MLDPLGIHRRVTGQETHGYALYHPTKQILLLGDPEVSGLGENLCQASLLSEGKPPLTTKSLSASPVYHSLRFSLAMAVNARRLRL
jgi:hypothetical protein